MTTRPGYIWSGTEWVAIGQEATASPVYYQASEPASAPTGSIWVNSGIEIPSAYANNYRWQYTATGGETSLTGMSYTPGYEQLYLNGILLVRGSDYVATSGSSITGLVALAAGDSVEMITVGTYPVADVYTQGQSDSKFSAKTATGMSLVVPTSISYSGGTAPTIATNGAITFGTNTSVTINGCFTSTYDNYKIVYDLPINAGGDVGVRLTSAGTAAAGATDYAWSKFYMSGTTLANNGGSTGASSATLFYTSTSVAGTLGTVEVITPYKAKYTSFNVVGTYAGIADIGYGVHKVATSYDGLYLFGSSAYISGTIRIYGYNNGA